MWPRVDAARNLGVGAAYARKRASAVAQQGAVSVVGLCGADILSLSNAQLRAARSAAATPLPVVLAGRSVTVMFMLTKHTVAPVFVAALPPAPLARGCSLRTAGEASCRPRRASGHGDEAQEPRAGLAHHQPPHGLPGYTRRPRQVEQPMMGYSLIYSQKVPSWGRGSVACVGGNRRRVARSIGAYSDVCVGVAAESDVLLASF